MAVTVSNLLVGPCDMYHAVFGATEPATIDDDVESPWTDVGGTLEGVQLKINQEMTRLEVDQLVDVAGSRLKTREITIETQLAEPTLENLKLALSGGSITTDATQSVYEPSMVTTADDLDYSAVLFEGKGSGGRRRRVIVRKVVSVEEMESTMGHKEDQYVWKVQLLGHYVSASIKPFTVIEAI